MNGKCERCKKDSNVTICSFFNTEMICMECKDKEVKHSDYKKAVNKEKEEVLNGNYNFEGIGLPNDLKV